MKKVITINENELREIVCEAVVNSVYAIIEHVFEQFEEDFNEKNFTKPVIYYKLALNGDRRALMKLLNYLGTHTGFSRPTLSHIVQQILDKKRLMVNQPMKQVV